MEVNNSELDLISITGGPLKNHEYVLVQQVMTAGDEAWIQDHSARSSGTLDDKRIVFTIGAVQLATCRRLIKGWNLTKEVSRPDGEKTVVAIPFSAAAIEKLPRNIYKYVLKKINEMNPDEEGGETGEAFLPVVVDSSEENFGAERVLRLKS